jgi:hypothetical protein
MSDDGPTQAGELRITLSDGSTFTTNQGSVAGVLRLMLYRRDQDASRKPNPNRSREPEERPQASIKRRAA